MPKEVVEAAPQAMLQMAAYGPEANFSFPPRPENRATPWNIEWTAKVRYRSSTGGILGMPMDAPATDERTPTGQSEQDKPKAKKPSAKDILRGLGVPRLP